MKFGIITAGLAMLTMALLGISTSLGDEPANPSAQNPARSVNRSLPPLLAEVARMNKAGLGDEVILAYIQKSPRSYSLTAEQLISLRERGISSRILQALLTHEPSQRSGAPAVASDGPQNPHPPEQSAVIYIPAPPPAPRKAGYRTFYQAVSPYGKWFWVPDRGWCWRPWVATNNPTWQPYGDTGSWLW